MKAIEASNIVVMLDMYGVIKSANKNFLNVTGYSEGQIKGMNHNKLVPAFYRDSDQYKAFLAPTKARADRER